MAVVIAVLNQKGGAGKTTIATNIAAQLQRKGANVLLVDSDPQGSARDWKAANENNAIPVVGIDRPTLAKDLPSIANPYDVVVIDGAPQLREMSASAIRVADAILIPVQPSALDIWAAKDLVDLIKVRQELTGGMPQAAFVVSRAIKNTHLSNEVADALSTYSIDVFSSRTTQRVAYVNSASEGAAVVDSTDEQARQEIELIVEELLQWVN
jgi:chromosome partitioning protein